jgi:hypothetical protein
MILFLPEIRHTSMALKNSVKSIARLPINITINKEDLESDDEVSISKPLIANMKKNRNGKQR